MAEANTEVLDTLQGDSTGAPESEVAVAEPRRRGKRTVDAAQQDLADLTPPTATVAETVETETEVAQPAQETTDPFLQRLEQEFGFSDLKDRNQAEERFLQYAREQQTQREELEAWRRQNEPLVGYGREYLSTRQAEQKPTATEAPKPWQPPVAFPDEISRYVTRNEATGDVEYKPDTPLPVRERADQYRAWRDNLVDMLATRPERFINEVIMPLIDERAKTVVEPFYEERTALQQEEQFLQQYATEHAAKIYQIDQRTNLPQHGVLSQRGQLLDQRYQALRERGLSVQEAMRYAELDVNTEAGGAPTKTTIAASAATTAQQQRRAVVERTRTATRQPKNRVGSYPLAGERLAQNDNGDFGADFLEELERRTPSAS